MGYEPPIGLDGELMHVAFEAADAVSSERGRSRGGYIRLGRVAGSAAEPYVIAVRMLKSGKVQFGCGCPDWKFRRQSNGTLCKHQQAVLTGGMSRKGSHRVWYYKAGVAFVEQLGVSADPSDDIA